ncbi:MAG: hypothetical protein WCX88_00565 [Patescibacteria group bacterium]
MTPYKVISNDLVVSLDKNKFYHTVNFTSEENPTLGKLFILGKVQTKDAELKKILDSLVVYINQLYLNKAHPNAEESLEEILQQANQEWQSQLAEADISLDDPETKGFFKNLNLLVGILQGTTVHFAYVGQTHVFLARNNNLIDILASMEAQENFNLLKIFSNIVTGNLKLDDVLFFSFADFVDCFSEEKIKRIIIDYPPKKACEYFEELIRPLESQKAFCATIFKVLDQKTVSTIPKITRVPVEHNGDSMKELILKQQQTQEFIRPKITPKIDKKFKDRLSNFIQNIFRPLKNLFSKINSRLEKINFKADINNSTTDIKFSDNKNNIEKGAPKQRSIYLPKQNKIYLILSLVFIILLGGVIFYSVKHQAQKKQEAQYQQFVSQIEEKQNLISAAMMYGDNNRAQELLGEIKTLMEQIPNNNPDLQAKYDELKKANQEKLDELLKLYKIEPTKVAEFTYDVNKLAFTPGSIYTWNNNALIKLNLADSTISELGQLKDTYGNIKNVTPLSETSLLVYTSNNKFVRFDTEQKLFFDFTVTTSVISSDFNDMLPYGSRLYALDTKTKQIYKYQNVEEKFEQEASWINDSTDISSLQNIAIDGNVWSITPKGEIYKFYTGKKEDYSYEINPEIVNSTKIYTELDWNNLYILDPGSNRIIILNKANGQIVKQFHADILTGLKDMVVIESQKLIYLLNDKTIYKISF